MGFYSFGRIKIISRGRGKSAVATAAYHSGSKIENEWDGSIHDYSNKPNVGETYIRMPDNAPEFLRDESVPAKERLAALWNSVEKFDDKIDAQLARKNYLALQHNLTMKQNLECVDRFIQENCTSIGMGVTYSVHRMPGNLHVDMMYLMRGFDEDGNFQNKSEKQYLVKNGDQKEWMNASQFKKAKEQGWEKIYKFTDGKNLFELTPSEAKGFPELTRKSKYPIDRKVDKQTWNSKDLASKWRESWANILNDKFEELGMPDRVDHRSKKDQGKFQLSTVHVGYGPDREDRIKLNETIIAFNKDLRAVADIGRRAMLGMERDLFDLEHKPQTAETITEQAENLRINEGILQTIIDSQFYQGEIQRLFERVRADFSRKIKKMIEKYQKQFKMAEELDFTPQKRTLEDMIKHGLAKGGTMQTTRTKKAFKDEFGEDITKKKN